MGLNIGEVGELIVSNFFDSNFSKIFSFLNPKTKNNAEVADILIWLNRTVFLIEVKTRSDEGSSTIQSWCHSKIKQAHSQILKNYNRIKEGEQIFLNNSYYHTELDCTGINEIIGLVVLVHDEKCDIEPSEYFSNIYDFEIPIHVISWKDLERLVDEIDTVPDFKYYLQDRFNYLKISDIRLDQELDVIGRYKLGINNFPDRATDFSSSYEKYKLEMEEKISERDKHNKNSVWIENLENVFTEHRKLLDGIPIGLYFAWELGVLSRRERAYYGEKLNSVQAWFNNGNSTRKFSWQSQSTGNWLLFYFSKLEDNSFKSLENMAKLKLIKEMESKSFEFGVYALGFNVSNIYPHQLLGLNDAIIMGTNIEYTEADIVESFKVFGEKSNYTAIPIKEFPE